ncbi:hypothetical protein Tco_0855057 [Tanacetum coccineum]
MCDGFSYSPTLSRLRDLGLRLKVKKQAPPSPDYIPGPKHTDDEIVAEDKPDAEDASPTAQLPDYVLESDPEADLEEDDDEDPDKTSRFETDESAAKPPPHPAYRVTARISILAPVPTPVWSDAEVARLLAISTPPSSPLSLLPAIDSRLRAEAASTSHSLPLTPPFILSPTITDAPSLGIPPPLPISVPTSSPPLLLPLSIRSRIEPEVTLLPRKEERNRPVISNILKADQRRSTEMRELRTTDHTRQQQLIQTLTVMQSLQG